MALSVEELKQLRDDLERVYLSGASSVAYDGKRIDYTPDIKDRLAAVDAQIAAAEGKRRPVAGFARFSRGC